MLRRAAELHMLQDWPEGQGISSSDINHTIVGEYETCSKHGGLLFGVFALDGRELDSRQIDWSHPVARRMEEMFGDDTDNPKYGHCDTCGAPCDENGCVRDQQHVAAIGGF